MGAEVVFKAKDGRILTSADLVNVDGTVDWEIVSGKTIPQEAIDMHNLGRQFGQKGENTKAIDSFKNASLIAPNWSYPYYDMAYTYLLDSKASLALENYNKADKHSPNGFFTTKTAVHYLSLEATGKLPEGLYIYYLSHEWGKSSEEQRVIFNNILSKFPSYGPAWEKMAGLVDEPEKKLEMIDRGLATAPDVETRGFLLINKAVTLFHLGQKQDAKDILGSLVFDSESPTDIVVLSKRTLAMLLGYVSK